MRAKNPCLPLAIPPTNGSQRLLEASNRLVAAHRTYGACICSPKAIVRAANGDYAAKCANMPWACPLKAPNRTPVV